MKEKGGQVLNLYKRLGETPLERLERLRREHRAYAQEVLSYAGRLDPMAEGVLLALVGSENKVRDRYLELPKEYVVDILFGYATDSYDILGKVVKEGDPSGVSKRRVRLELKEFRGPIVQEYPPFSSKSLEGKSLFEWARSTAREVLVLPRKKTVVYDLELLDMYRVKERLLASYISTSVGRVEGDFRQEEILRLWGRTLTSEGVREFPCARIRVSCGSGTYMRSIANTLGERMGVPALALHILRTKVGEYSVEDSLK